ncbi:hypothetical protein [Roseinatronobacter sp. S2]|uniref:hypothetical protein n=1 Tax=Roseinatronobacter sp. S2 TaxID=3035471 RepID=UPI00240FF11C|nr:hypothetical protein [Roseinatronobacter sp. S2]WFE74463.1 hypothetical protein P8S53_14920 [Roseinatronobacter sp. S2]
MTQARFQRMSRTAGGIALVFVLAGCLGAPMATGPNRVIPAPTTAPQSGTQPMGTTGTSSAEQACIAAGQERGFEVLGVAGSRSATGSDGQEERDVLLRLSRNGTQTEARCNYQTATGMAQIMII